MFFLRPHLLAQTMQAKRSKISECMHIRSQTHMHACMHGLANVRRQKHAWKKVERLGAAKCTLHAFDFSCLQVSCIMHSMVACMLLLTSSCTYVYVFLTVFLIATEAMEASPPSEAIDCMHVCTCIHACMGSKACMYEVVSPGADGQSVACSSVKLHHHAHA